MASKAHSMVERRRRKTRALFLQMDGVVSWPAQITLAVSSEERTYRQFGTDFILNSQIMLCISIWKKFSGTQVSTTT
jgi:hypothetical protein